MGDELTALAALDRRCHRDFDAEFIGLVGFAFADALHLRCVQAVNFLPPLLGPLRMDPLSQRQFWCEGRPQIGVVFDLTTNIAHHSAELRSKSLQRPVGTFECKRQLIHALRLLP